MDKLLVIFIVMLLTSCATIINDANEEIPIRSNPSGANVRVSYYNNECTTPCVMSLKRGRDYNLIITKEGYEEERIHLDGQSLDAWLWGNVIFGGAIGIAIDFGTGHAYDFAPETVVIPLTPNAKVAKDTTKGEK